MRKTSVRYMTESAVMLALSIVLSFIKLYRFPLGGSLTLASMLPVMLISMKYRARRGLPVAFLYSLFQLAEALMQGDVFPWIETLGALLFCILFDYLIPFTALGFAGGFRKPAHRISYLSGIGISIALRFVCHFLTGIVIWKQWTPDGYTPALYSLAYNGGFLLPELILTLAVAAVFLASPVSRKLLDTD